MLKDISDIVIAKKQTLSEAANGEEGTQENGENGFVFETWSELDLKVLKRNVKKLKTNFPLLKQYVFPSRSTDEIARAWAYCRKKK